MKIPTLEQCADFLRDGGPINSAELSRALGAKLTAAQLRERIKQEKASVDGYLDRLERASKAEKAKREERLTATEEAYRKQHEERRAIERRASSKKAPAKPAALSKPAPKPTPETARDKAKREYSALTDEKQKRTYRIRNWSLLSGKITAPEPKR